MEWGLYQKSVILGLTRNLRIEVRVRRDGAKMTAGPVTASGTFDTASGSESIFVSLAQAWLEASEEFLLGSGTN